MYLNVIVCTPGGDHPEAERPVSIPTTSTSTSMACNLLDLCLALTAGEETIKVFEFEFVQESSWESVPIDDTNQKKKM